MCSIITNNNNYYTTVDVSIEIKYIFCMKIGAYFLPGFTTRKVVFKSETQCVAITRNNYIASYITVCSACPTWENPCLCVCLHAMHDPMNKMWAWSKFCAVMLHIQVCLPSTVELLLHQVMCMCGGGERRGYHHCTVFFALPSTSAFFIMILHYSNFLTVSWCISRINEG